MPPQPRVLIIQLAPILGPVDQPIPCAHQEPTVLLARALRFDAREAPSALALASQEVSVVAPVLLEPIVTMVLRIQRHVVYF